MRKLVVNADDFGMTAGINRGVIDAHRQGIVTSTSIMANGAALDDGLARLRGVPELGAGCHLVLVGGRPVAPEDEVTSLTDPGGNFPRSLSAFLRRVTTGRIRYEEIVTEFRAQIDRLEDAGIRPDHLNTRLHTHAHPLVLNAVVQVAEEYEIPYLRNPFEWERMRTVRTWGDRKLRKRHRVSRSLVYYRSYFHSRMADTTVAAPERFLGFIAAGRLSPGMMKVFMDQATEGLTELVCHPGHVDDDLRAAGTRLKESRASDLAALTSAETRSAISRNSITLTTFRAMAEGPR